MPPGTRPFRRSVEKILPVTEAVVVLDAASAGFHPILVEPVELIGIPYQLGRAQMDRRVVKFDAQAARLQFRGAREIHLPPIRGHLRQMSGGRVAHAYSRLGVEYREAAAGGEPQASVRHAIAASAHRKRGRTLRAPQAVFHAVIERFERLAAALRKILELLFQNAADSARGGQP
jgi:hypothetical protein